MTVKAVIDRAKAVQGCVGVAVYAGEDLVYSDLADDGCASALLRLLCESPGARRASAVIGSFTFAASRAGDYAILLKVAGRFPTIPWISDSEPSFVDPSCAPDLPSRDEARREAEAALRQLGVLP